MKSIGALSRSPSPITTLPSICILLTRRSHPRLPDPQRPCRRDREIGLPTLPPALLRERFQVLDAIQQLLGRNGNYRWHPQHLISCDGTCRLTCLAEVI